MRNNDNLKQETPTDANNVLAVRLITNFMGWVDSPYPNLPNKVYTKDLSEGKHLDHFRYCESWDDIMPVVSKIQDTRSQYTYFHGCEHYDAIIENLCCVDISSLFKNCVEFVKWWNTFQGDS